MDAAIDPEVDFVMSAIVGVAGLEATYEAIRRGKRVGLANKEVLGGQRPTGYGSRAEVRRRIDPRG